MFQLEMKQQLSDTISTTRQHFWKLRCNRHVRFLIQEEKKTNILTVVVTKLQQLLILWLWEYTCCRTSMCYSNALFGLQQIFTGAPVILSNNVWKWNIWSGFLKLFFLDPPTRVMFWTRKRRMMTSSSAVLDRSSTVIGPNCCSPGSGQYCRQGWGARAREREKR